MRDLSSEQIAYVVARLIQIVESRGIKQTQLEQMSGVKQSTISKIFGRSSLAGEDHYDPSEEVLRKLLQALGLKLSSILSEPGGLPDELLGYLASPLTGLSPSQDAELRKVVQQIRSVAADTNFDPPRFDVYWPGDHTHPLDQPNIPAEQVYVTDRSRAATHDFIILFCAAPSYGVGQENEIASQGGVPAIRLIPEQGLSRMMLGSFIHAIDIPYSGSLGTAVSFDRDELANALREIRKSCFRRRAFDRGLVLNEFGDRFRRLLDDRCNGDYVQVASDLGISLTYLHVLMKEPLAVSNPSARLLGRIAARLGERVAYLLGESNETDPVWIDSNATWRAWIEKTANVSACDAIELRDEWRGSYRMARRSQLVSAASFRNALRPLTITDWDKRYQLKLKKQQAANASQNKLF